MGQASSTCCIRNYWSARRIELPTFARGTKVSPMDKDRVLSQAEQAEFVELVSCFEVVEEHVLDGSSLHMIYDS